jgi:hypothetical protein
MGMMYARHIAKAADHLMQILLAEARVPYSRFYDGTEETQRKLAEGMGMSPEDAEWYGAEGIMDEAAAALAAQGYVKLTPLDEKLADDEPAYEIELLARGRAMLAAGKRPVFRDLDL